MSNHGENRNIARRTICDCCLEVMQKAHAVFDNVAYCNKCYAREFERTTCPGCSQATRTPKGKKPAICKKCRVKDRKCLRCGKPVPRAAKTMPEGVACPSCARYFNEPQPCPVCGQLSLHLARDYKAGYTDPVCQRCRRKSHITCPICHKHRRPAGADSEGRIVCKHCMKLDGSPFICPKCGNDGIRHSASQCEACYWEKYAGKKVRTIIGMLENDWLQDVFNGFCETLIERIGSRNAALRLDRYAIFFAKIDCVCSKPSDLSDEQLIDLFGKEGLRRQAVPYGYLVRCSLFPIVSEARRESITEETRQRTIIKHCETHWYHVLLCKYHTNLLELSNRYSNRGWNGTKQRISPRAITSNLRAAAKFLAHIDSVHLVYESHQINQAHINDFIFVHPGYRMPIRAFVRFLNRKVKLFRQVSIPQTVQSFPQRLLLDRSRYSSLLKEWLQATDRAQKEALICLIMLLYAQSITKVVSMRISDLHKNPDNTYRVKFGKTEIQLDHRISNLMTQYLSSRKVLALMEDADENNYIFPGRRHGSHLSESTVSYYLKKKHLSADQLFTSAVYYAYMNGMQHPKVLSKAFGISDTTAIRYLNLINPRLVIETNQRIASNR